MSTDIRWSTGDRAPIRRPDPTSTRRPGRPRRTGPSRGRPRSPGPPRRDRVRPSDRSSVSRQPSNVAARQRAGRRREVSRPAGRTIDRLDGGSRSFCRRYERVCINTHPEGIRANNLWDCGPIVSRGRRSAGSDGRWYSVTSPQLGRNQRSDGARSSDRDAPSQKR